VAAPVLVIEEVMRGQAAMDALRDDPVLKPTAFLWRFDENANEWKFLVATDEVTRSGPRSAYRRIRSILKKKGLLLAMPLRRVVVISPSDNLLRAIKEFHRSRMPWERIANCRLMDCDLGEGLGVTNVFIYRSP
jgi:hypothetical protein